MDNTNAMQRRPLRHLLPLAAVFLVAAGAVPAQQADPWQDVAAALGRAGEERDGVYRVTFPRSDLRVRVGGVTVRPGLALTSWAAFQRAGEAAMVMGDLVVRSGELNPAVSKLLEGGIEVTAIHNHLNGESPRVMYVHFRGHGDAAKLAATLRSALAVTATPLATPRPRRSTAPPLDVDALSDILGRPGTARSGVVSFSIPRAERITGGPAAAGLGPRMGLGTAINFQREGSGAVATGDFVLLAGEVQPVIRALRQHGIDVTALHNHMLDERPRLFFLHFWGRGPADELARGLRAALDATNHAPPAATP